MKKRIISLLLVLLLLFALMPVSSAAVATPSVTAQAAVVMDFATGELLFSRDPDTLRAPASMTKIMTAFIVYEEIAAGRLTLDTMVPISTHASNFERNAWPGHLVIAAGGYYSVETLLRLIMLPSHNAGCVAFAEFISGSEAAFVVRMNEEAARLGMDAVYENSHGLWGNRKSAHSVAILLRAFIQDHPDILRITSMRTMNFKGATVNNTNRILSAPHIDGFKTGTTAAAGPCLASTASRDGQRVIAVTMNSTNNDHRFWDSERLLDFGLAELEHQASLIENLTAGVTADVSAVRRNTNFNLTAQLSGVAGSVVLPGGGWIINGATEHTFGPFSTGNQQSFTLGPIRILEDLPSLAIEFFIDLPNGGRVSATLGLPVSDAPPALFWDIDSHWSEDYVERAVAQELFLGFADGSFAPDQHMTRGQFVLVLGRLARGMGIEITSDQPTPFYDVEPWFADELSWAFELDIVRGVSETQFGTDRTITRQEAATLLYRFKVHYDIHLPGDLPPTFSDDAAISDWAVDAVVAAARTGLIVGHADGRFAPHGTATRAQVAVIFLRLLDRL